MAKKKKLEKFDGFGPIEKQKVRNAIRQVWQRSYARKLVVARCTGKDGFPRCEGKNCPNKGRRVPKVSIDHLVPAGELGPGFLERLFVPSSQMQGLCKECHRVKTNEENRVRRARLKAEKEYDFR